MGATPFGVHRIVEERPGRVWRRFSKGFGRWAIVNDVTWLPAINAGEVRAIAADVADGAATPTTLGIPARRNNLYEDCTMPCSRKVVFRFHEMTAEHVGRDSVGRRRAVLGPKRAAVDVEWSDSGRGSLWRRNHERLKLLHCE